MAIPFVTHECCAGITIFIRELNVTRGLAFLHGVDKNIYILLFQWSLCTPQIMLLEPLNQISFPIDWSTDMLILEYQIKTTFLKFVVHC